MTQDTPSYTALLTLETAEAFILKHFSFTIETGVQQYAALHNTKPVTYLEGKGEINPDVFALGDTMYEPTALLAIHTSEGDIERTMTITHVSLSSQYPGEITLHARLFTPHHD
jgi:hypothetical protein